MTKKMILSIFCAVIACLAVSCTTLATASALDSIISDCGKALSALGNPLPANAEDMGNNLYKEKDVFFIIEDNAIVVSATARVAYPNRKIRDINTGRSEPNGYGGYRTVYDEIEEEEALLGQYWEFLEKNSFLIYSGDGSPGTIYQRGSIFAKILSGNQRDDGGIPLSLWFSRDLAAF